MIFVRDTLNAPSSDTPSDSGPRLQSSSSGLQGHTVRAFDADLGDLVRMLAEMGGLAEKSVMQAVAALTGRNLQLASTVVEADSVIDALQRQIEEKAVATVALRQPVAVDLRSIIAILRATNDLERIGDLAKNIAKRVIALNGRYAAPQALLGLRHMADLACWQLHEVLESLALRDDRKAMSVWKGDEEIDSIYTSLFREVLTYVMEDPGSIAFSIHLLFCAKNVERIGDHVTNIAEAVHYMIKGNPFQTERPKSDMTSTMHFSTTR